MKARFAGGRIFHWVPLGRDHGHVGGDFDPVKIHPAIQPKLKGNGVARVFSSDFKLFFASLIEGCFDPAGSDIHLPIAAQSLRRMPGRLGDTGALVQNESVLGDGQGRIVSKKPAERSGVSCVEKNVLTVDEITMNPSVTT